jgi:hypothetical protein
LTHNPDVIIGSELWLSEGISNGEVFWDNYTTFRRDRTTRGAGVFICIKNSIACVELWVDKNFEMIWVDKNFEMITAEVKAGTLNLRGKS